MVKGKIMMQVFALMSCVGVSTGGIYYASSSEENYEYKDFESNLPSNYLMVEAKTNESLFIEKFKNYKCEITNNLNDDHCVLYKYTSTENIIDFDKLQLESNLMKDQDNLTKNKRYILRLSAEKYSKATKTGEINLIKKDGSKFSLEIKHDLHQNEETIKSNFFIAKAIKTGSALTADSTFKCNLLNQEIPCVVKQLNPIKNNTSWHSKANISSSSMPQKTAVIDTYYWIELTGDKKTIKDLRSTNIKVTATPPSSSTASPYGEFKYEQLLLGSFNEKSETLFLYERYQTLVVTSSEPSTNPSKDLWTENWKKKYKCKITTVEDLEIIDENCELYEIEYTSLNNSNVNKVKYGFKEIKKTDELKTKTFYKLKAFAKSKIKKVELLFPLIENQKPETILSTLTPKFELIGHKFVGDASFFAGTASLPEINAGQTLKCKIGEEGLKNECEIYIIEPKTPGESAFRFLDFSKISKISSTSSTTRYVVVNLKNQTFNTSEVIFTSNKKIKMEVYKENEEGKLFDFAIDTALDIVFQEGTKAKAIFWN